MLSNDERQRLLDVARRYRPLALKSWLFDGGAGMLLLLVLALATGLALLLAVCLLLVATGTLR